MKVVLDTCAILWAVSEPEVLTEKSRSVLISESTEVLVSPISCAEIACAVERQRILLDRHWRLWFRHFVELNQWTVVPIGLSVIEEAYSLPEYTRRDPADRIIVATARKQDCAVITADREIVEYPHVDTIW